MKKYGKIKNKKYNNKGLLPLVIRKAQHTFWITSGFALVMTMHFCHCERMRGNLRHCD